MKKSVLIVEDEAPTSAAFASVLRNADWEVTEAEDGATALRSLAQIRVSVILLDLRLPDMSGFDVLERAKRLYGSADLPLVVVISAYIDANAWSKFFEFPISVMIPKPIAPAFLPDLLKAVFEQNETALANLPETTQQVLHVYVAGVGEKRSYIYRRPAEPSLDTAGIGQPVTRLKSLSQIVDRRETKKKARMRLVRAFLCHSSPDKPFVRTLYTRLRSDLVEPWLDEENLLAGQDWDLEIRTAVHASDVVIACLSKNATTRAGYLQKEIKYALDVADEQPEGAVFIIPIKIEECDMPVRLSRWQWINFQEDDGYGKLIRSLRARARILGLR